MEIIKILLAASFKYIFTAIVSFVVLDVFFENYFIHVLLISVIITIINYLFGSIFLYKYLHYKLASLIVGFVDGILIFLISKWIDKLHVNFGIVLIYMIVLAVFEYYYNKYMYSHMA